MRQAMALVGAGLAACICLILMAPAFAQDAGGQAEIRRSLIHIFAKADDPLSLDPIVVEADAAIVGWVQGSLAGRAFLRKKDGQWSIVACGGDALKNAEKLQALGLDRARAAALAGKLTAAEKVIDPRRVALFSSFDGVVVMGHEPAAPAHARQ